MNFQPFSVGTRLYTAAEQAAAWDAYISQDSYLSEHRGEYAERGAIFLPMVHRLDFSVTQDFFATIKGHRHTFQIRADILNFGNLLNEDWGVGQRLINTQPLIVPTAAQGGVADAAGPRAVPAPRHQQRADDQVAGTDRRTRRRLPVPDHAAVPVLESRCRAIRPASVLPTQSRKGAFDERAPFLLSSCLMPECLAMPDVAVELARIGRSLLPASQVRRRRCRRHGPHRRPRHRPARAVAAPAD